MTKGIPMTARKIMSKRQARPTLARSTRTARATTLSARATTLAKKGGGPKKGGKSGGKKGC